MPSPRTSGSILISSAGRRVGLVRAFSAALRELDLDGQVLTSDMSPLSSAGLASDRHVLVPPCTDDRFVPTLLELCEQAEIRLVVPTIDTELLTLATHREVFSDQGVAVAISSEPVVAIGSDKTLTHDWLVKAGLPTVAQAEVAGERPPFDYPFLLKPRFGSASIGVRTVRDRIGLDAALADETELVAQELATGQEFTIDLLADADGKCLCAVPRERIETRGGEVSKAVTRQIDELNKLAVKACESLPRPFGPLTLQVFWNRATREAKVIELNPRFGGGYPLSWEAGANFPRWLVEEAMGLPHSDATLQWRADLAMLRFDDGLFVAANEVGL
jgi:carbamoyl-phosphate synthase large subunit